MKRVQTRNAGLAPVCVGAAWLAFALLVPAAAFAEEGHGLVLVPDWFGKLPALILLFGVLIAPVNALVIRPLLRVLDERDTRIGGTRAKAERLERDAAEILARYENTVRATREEGEGARRALLTEVRSEVQREVAAARSDADARLQGARGEIKASLDTARGALRGQAQDLARQAASQVLGRAL